MAYQPDTEEVYETLRSFARSTGLGPSWLPVQALKSLCTRVGTGVEAEESKCPQTLTRFVGDILSGTLVTVV